MNAGHKNILIVLDAAGCTSVSMHTVTELASTMQASIQALYIEDINLLNAVGLPFTREVSLHTAAISSIDATSMTQQFRADAESVKKQIEKIAVTQRVSLSFSTMRGQKTQVIKNQADEVNMVLIPAVYSSNIRKQQHSLKHEIVFVYEEQNASYDKALNIALAQAAKKNHPLFIILDSGQSKQHIEQIASQHSGRVTYRVADFSSLSDIISILYQHAPGLLVVPAGSCLVNDEQVLRQLINSLESDILLVR